MNANATPRNETDEQAAAKERINLLRKPWYRWQSSALQIAMVVFVVAWFFLPTTLQHERWSQGVFVGILVILFSLNQRLREKAWREVVQKEAPELFRRINEGS